MNYILNMSSILAGFEYDIFISYRQKDNKYDGWVTEFVANLKKELEATFKEDISIYFDENPHDGLLETHNVDKSLEGKLKCLIFIPIISQTYCDPKSFAWQHEFCVFNKLAKGDQFGRDIKLSNGNVASRVLPVKIHDLDAEDKAVFENELGGVLRSIEFIYREAGVNRPLKSTDNKNDNQNKTDYRNQVNKVANAIKEIITSLKKPSSPSVPTTGNLQPVTDSLKPATRDRSSFNQKKIRITLFLLAILATVGYFIYSKSTTPSDQKTEALDKSIAVLPFVNMNNNPDQEYFSDGITVDLISQFSKINDLRVISWASVMRYKSSQKDFSKIAGELNVATVLQGVVRQSGNKVRISANLINAITGEQLWSEVYDREMKDIFDIQSSVSLQIANALQAKLSPVQHARLEKQPTQNVEAYQLYLRGKYHWGKLRKPNELALALELYKKAIRKDPNFALAYVGLADTYSLIAYFQLTSILPAREAMLNAKEAAWKALTLDNSLAEAHTSMGYILRTYDWNWSAAEEAYKKGIELNSNYATGHDYYALLLTGLGRFDEAIKESQKALQLDPFSLVTNVDAIRILRFSGKLKESMEMIHRLLEIDPDSKLAYSLMGSLLEQTGEKDSAVVAFIQSEEHVLSLDEKEHVMSPDEIKEGKTFDKFCQVVLQKALRDSVNYSAEEIAKAYVRVGNHDKAIQYLQKSYKNHEGTLVYLNVEPLYKPLHNDIRFKNLVLSMGLRPNAD